jgi:hypothetical protein
MAFAPYLPIDTVGTPNLDSPLAGTTWWCAFDWYTHQLKAGFQSMGLMKMDRATTKLVYDHLASMYKKYVDRSEYITAVEPLSAPVLPAAYRLQQNYPNPFNPATTITYSIPSESMVSLKVFDLLGQEIVTLVDEFQQPGMHRVEFDLRDREAGSGVYFYRLQHSGHIETKRMVRLK